MTSFIHPIASSNSCKRLHQPVIDALRSGHVLIAATDEAGAGPLAGPVVAAAVLLLAEHPLPDIPHLNDSKRLTALRRAQVRRAIIQSPHLATSLCVVGVDVIDRINIRNARLRAMAQAVDALPHTPDLLFVDGDCTLDVDARQQSAVVRGDASVSLIAAASVLAKERRDEIMCELHQQFPMYGFAKHKGYATRMHLETLNHCGPCAAHRKSFRPVREALERQRELS